MQTYKLIFDASAFDPDYWKFFAIGPLFILIGIVLFIFRGKPKVTWFSNWPPHPVFAAFFLGFSIIWTLMALSAQIPVWFEARNTAVSKTYLVVFGPVTDFVPGAKEDSFKVQGVRFRVPEYELTPGFHHIEASGGPVHANSHVRIGYICKPSKADCSNPLIVRLEMLN